jgi:hypothetical protein
VLPLEFSTDQTFGSLLRNAILDAKVDWLPSGDGPFKMELRRFGI